MIDDMGIFRTTIAIENGTRRGVLRMLADVMVDTGSEYTWVPASVLNDLGLSPERRVTFVTADGRRIERPVAFAIVHAGGTSAPDIVVSGEPGDRTLLGAHSIEGLNLRLDLVTKELVPAGPVPVAPAARVLDRRTALLTSSPPSTPRRNGLHREEGRLCWRK
jgi:predicted aspartyl protease